MVAVYPTSRRVHAIRGRGEKQRSGSASSLWVFVVQQTLRQHDGEVLRIWLQQILVPLELVQDHEIRLERRDTDYRHDAANLTNQLVAGFVQTVGECAFPCQSVSQIVEQLTKGLSTVGAARLFNLCEQCIEISQ